MSLPSQTLDGKIAIVTGAGRGIGRGIARALAKAGAGVAILELDPATGSATADEITASGGHAFALAGSVRERADCEAIVAAASDRFGGVDVLVNNAQQVPMGPLDTCTDDDMYTAWESGALAAFRLMQLCHPLMRERGGGAIVNLGSGAGTEGVAGLGAYAVAKEGIRALTKIATLEWGGDNIRVNTVCPWAENEYWIGLSDAQRAARLRHNPLKRIGDPEADIGAVVVFLAGDAGSYVTGQTVHVDGGNMGFR
jgi:NAD(P)-dependent dehydrogenase (short-subunit alcohol dehydrogenase family)